MTIKLYQTDLPAPSSEILRTFCNRYLHLIEDYGYYISIILDMIFFQIKSKSFISQLHQQIVKRIAIQMLFVPVVHSAEDIYVPVYQATKEMELWAIVTVSIFVFNLSVD